MDAPPAPGSLHDPPPSAPYPIRVLAAFSCATRVAGTVIALGYLTGLVRGPLVVVVGALGLITFGNALLLNRRDAAAAAAALAVVAGALGIGALRWQTLDLQRLRGAQAVLGPSIWVGPPEAAIACGIGLAACVVALAVWLLLPIGRPRLYWVWMGVELVIASLAAVTVFADPAYSALGGAGAGAALIAFALWAVVVAVVGALTFCLSYFVFRRSREAWSWGALATAGASLIAGGALVATTL